MSLHNLIKKSEGRVTSESFRKADISQAYGLFSSVIFAIRIYQSIYDTHTPVNITSEIKELPPLRTHILPVEDTIVFISKNHEGTI